LGLEYIYAGRLEIKCHNCNHLNIINFKTTKAEVDKLFSWNEELKGGEQIKKDNG
jgi:phage FluMu protein Com